MKIPWGGMGLTGWGCHKHELPSEKWEFHQAKTEGESKGGFKLWQEALQGISEQREEQLRVEVSKKYLKKNIGAKNIFKNTIKWWAIRIMDVGEGAASLWAAEAPFLLTIPQNFLIELKKGAQKRSNSTAAQPGNVQLPKADK